MKPNFKVGTWQRNWILDSTRGAAVVAMVLYHFGFLMMYIGWIDVAVTNPYWRLLGRVISSTFLIVVGVSLTIWYEKNASRFGPEVILRRLLGKSLYISAAAGLVTLGTLAVVPDEAVWFGVLHFIALAQVLSYPWLRFKLNVWPWILALVGGGWFLQMTSWPTWWLLPLGFMPVGFQSLDYFPVFPKFALVLVGIELGRRLFIKRPQPKSLIRPPSGILTASLIWIGQRALLIYLVHVPVLLLIVWLIAKSLGLESELP
jgi:uncharacterized membrane protein